MQEIPTEQQPPPVPQTPIEDTQKLHKVNAERPEHVVATNEIEALILKYSGQDGLRRYRVDMEPKVPMMQKYPTPHFLPYQPNSGKAYPEHQAVVPYQLPVRKNHKLRWFLIIACIVLFLALLGGIRQETGNVATTWNTTQTFTGNGNKTTEVFFLSDSAKVLWEGDPSSFYGGEYNLIVTVKSSDGSLVDLPINTIVKAGNTSGESMIQNHSGEVYFEVMSEGAWTVTVQELS